MMWGTIFRNYYIGNPDAVFLPGERNEVSSFLEKVNLHLKLFFPFAAELRGTDHACCCIPLSSHFLRSCCGLALLRREINEVVNSAMARSLPEGCLVRLLPDPLHPVCVDCGSIGFQWIGTTIHCKDGITTARRSNLRLSIPLRCFQQPLYDS